MKTRLTHIDPLQAGKVLAALYLGLSLLFIPFFFLLMVIAPSLPHQPGTPNPGAAFAGMGLFFVIIIPVFYTIIGFVGGAIAALVYNLAAKVTGGLELTFLQVTPPLPDASAAVYSPR